MPRASVNARGGPHAHKKFAGTVAEIVEQMDAQRVKTSWCRWADMTDADWRELYAISGRQRREYIERWSGTPGFNARG